MAICKNCGTVASCSCQLKEGLCGACFAALHKLINTCKNAIK